MSPLEIMASGGASSKLKVTARISKLSVRRDRPFMIAAGLVTNEDHETFLD
jgi:hypothetical protein